MREKNNRKDFATRVDADLKILFQETCKKNNYTMSEVMEALMEEYIEGNYVLKKQTKYKAIKIK